MQTNADLEDRFSFHKATPETAPVHEHIRALCKKLAYELSDLLPEGRNKSLALTALEDVMMRSNAAVAIGGVRQSGPNL